MMRTLLTFLFTGLVLQASAQTGKLYRGTINKSIQITLYLEGLDNGTNADPIVGSYKYDTQSSYLLVNGYINNKGNVVLVEQGSANFTGVFLGAFQDHKIIGNWFSDDYKKSYPFELVEAAANKAQAAKFKAAIAAKARQFSAY